MEKRMTSGNSMKLLIGFTVPLIIGNIFQQMYSISDVIIVGRTIGVNALASVGTAAPLFMLFVMMTMGLSNGFTVLTGQFYGAGDEKKMRHSVATSIMLAILAVVVFDIIVYFIIDPALGWLNVPPELYKDCRAYTVIVAEGLWAMMAYNFLSALLRALGDSRTPVVFLILATIVNVLLALLFIIVFHWGVPGSAYALVIAQAFSSLLCFLYIGKHLPILRLHREDWKWDTSFALDHLRMGFPMAVQFSAIGLGVLLIQSVTNNFGPEVIAGFTAATRVEQLAIQPMASLGVAVAVFTAQNFGARQFDRIRDAVRKCSGIALGFALFMAILIFFGGEHIVAIFVDRSETSVVDAARAYLHLSVAFYFFLSQIFIYRSAAQGLGVGWVPLVSSVLELCMRAGAAEILAVGWGWGFRGVCFASPIAWVAAASFTFAAYHALINIFERQHLQGRL
ncbi:MAG: MATE family efflux transporter [Succiniclasticum sp.]|jgi:putative MATE family efflux protein